MQSTKFSRKPLAAAVAMALGATAFSQAQAQDEEVLEEIVTTGIRGSLIQSMDRKRDAKGVVDAITAEDIGKFPDQNLAESLQRITGVSIERSNNEGSRITVRGMGPEFNLVTLNGRTMPTAGGRSFDFADIASEGVSAVEIYKTGKANLPTGGIGATVNIITAKPLENPGFRSVVSGKVVHETSSSNSNVGSLDEFTPEVAAMYSNTFADDTFGVLVTASYQERDNREENAEVAFWTQNGQLDGGVVNNNNQRADGVWWHPQNIGYGWGDISRDRLNTQLVLQYAPIDTLTATLDYTYSEVDFEKDANSTGIWFECPNIEATVNERGTVTQVSQACGDYSTNVAREHTIKENDSIGFNLDWQATDGFSFSMDWHTSSSQLEGGGVGDEPTLSSANMIIGNTNCPWCDPTAGFGDPTAGISNQTAFYTGGGIPTFDVSFAAPDGSSQATLLRSDLGSLFGQAFSSETYNDIDQFQLGATWENMDSGAIKSINFGVSRTEQEFDTRAAESGLLPAGFWLTSAQYWPDDIWQEGNLGSLLSGFSNGGNFSYDPYYTVGFDTAVDLFETVGVGDPIGCGVYACGWGADFQDTANNRGRLWSGPLGNRGGALVEETIDSFYVQAVFEDEFNGIPLNAVVGLRYEESTQKSFGREVAATGIVWTGGNEFDYDFGAESQAAGRGENDFWLPSLDVDMEVKEDLIARFSYSRTLARPPIGALSPTRSFLGRPNARNRNISSGNPGLLPYLSDNFDLSLEWYYGDGSYASVGYFKKKVDNFLVSTTVESTVNGILDVYLSDEAEQARAELVGEGTSPDDQAVFARINLNRGANPTDPIRVVGGAAPEAIFDISTTANAETGNLFGYEFAIQHMFGYSGFGVQANMTIVNGDVDADRDIVGRQFALPGLSDSANLSVFYENDVISARIAYNWRDEFLTGFDNDQSPVFVEEYAPIDLNVTWYASDNLAVFFEAINITEEVQRVYVRYPEQFLRGNEYGARYNIGARYNFD